MATGRYGVVFKMCHIYMYMEMVGTTVDGVREFDPKMIVSFLAKPIMFIIVA